MARSATTLRGRSGDTFFSVWVLARACKSPSGQRWHRRRHGVARHVVARPRGLARLSQGLFVGDGHAVRLRSQRYPLAPAEVLHALRHTALDCGERCIGVHHHRAAGVDLLGGDRHRRPAEGLAQGDDFRLASGRGGARIASRCPCDGGCASGLRREDDGGAVGAPRNKGQHPWSVSPMPTRSRTSPSTSRGCLASGRRPKRPSIPSCFTKLRGAVTRTAAYSATVTRSRVRRLKKPLRARTWQNFVRTLTL